MILRVPTISRIKEVFRENPMLKYVSEFKDLTAKEMVFVILYADPLSPLYGRKTINKLTDIEYRGHIAGLIGITSKSKYEAIIYKTNNGLEEAITYYQEMYPFNRPSLEALITAEKNVNERMCIMPKTPREAKELAQLIKDDSIEVIRDAIKKKVEEYKDAEQKFRAQFLEQEASLEKDAEEEKAVVEPEEDTPLTEDDDW